MDILTHTLSGLAVGTVAASFMKGTIGQRLVVLFFSALGGSVPDVDAISLWSGFDTTFGRWFGLDDPGKVIYSARFWHSHHGFMHSLTAAFCLAFLIGLCFSVIDKVIYRKDTSLFVDLKSRRFLLMGFAGGYIVHLLEDMLTPGGPWNGIRFLFPLNTYIGGTGEIWWWNNYDIFLIVLSVLVINLFLLFVLPSRLQVWRFTSFVLITSFLLVGIQVKSRGVDFNRGDYSVNEQESLQIQQRILGDGVYKPMVRFDKSLKIYF